MRGKTKGTTDKYLQYISKNHIEFLNFADKLICARVNFKNGKKKANGLTISAAAKKLGISSGYLSELETGKSDVPSYIVINKLASGYGIQTDVLIESLKAAMK